MGSYLAVDVTVLRDLAVWFSSFGETESETLSAHLTFHLSRQAPHCEKVHNRSEDSLSEVWIVQISSL